MSTVAAELLSHGLRFRGSERRKNLITVSNILAELEVKGVVKMIHSNLETRPKQYVISSNDKAATLWRHAAAL